MRPHRGLFYFTHFHSPKASGKFHVHQTQPTGLKYGPRITNAIYDIAGILTHKDAGIALTIKKIALNKQIKNVLEEIQKSLQPGFDKALTSLNNARKSLQDCEHGHKKQN